jgi:hypothetical protein
MSNGNMNNNNNITTKIFGKYASRSTNLIDPIEVTKFESHVVQVVGIVMNKYVRMGKPRTALIGRYP